MQQLHADLCLTAPGGRIVHTLNCNVRQVWCEVSMVSQLLECLLFDSQEESPPVYFAPPRSDVHMCPIVHLTSLLSVLKYYGTLLHAAVCRMRSFVAPTCWKSEQQPLQPTASSTAPAASSNRPNISVLEIKVMIVMASALALQ